MPLTSFNFLPKYTSKSVGALFVEILLFIGLFSMVGHLTIHCWEKHLIHSELSNMKTSLNSLKVSVDRIGTAYDNLNKELEEFSENDQLQLDTKQVEKYQRYHGLPKDYEKQATNKDDHCTQQPPTKSKWVLKNNDCPCHKLKNMTS